MSLQFHVLLAFTFASPAILWGLALAGIPLAIHLLQKRKHRETTWAAMRFLLEAARKNSRRVRLEQLVLLTVRTLVLLLLIGAMAQPYVESFGGFFEADAPTHRIIVVDTSYGMGYRPAKDSWFDRAREIARTIVSRSSSGDAFNLVRISGTTPQVVIREPSYRKQQVTEEIERLELTQERGDLSATLEAVEELLRSVPNIKHKEVVFLSGFQRGIWGGSEPVVATQSKPILKRLSEKAELVLVDVARDDGANVVVTDFTTNAPFLTVDRPVPIHAVLRNFGPRPLSSQLVELRVDGRLAQTQRVDLPIDTPVPVELIHEFRSKGEHRLELRLEPDGLDIDDRRWLSLPVAEELNILLVNGKQSGKVMGRATDYVRLALSPSLPKQPWTGIVRPRVISDGELSGTDLSRYDCVFLCNVATVTERESRLLQAFVESGGGLVIGLGDQARAENYNRFLYAEGRGVLPGRLGNVIGKNDADAGFDFDPGDFAHPIVAPFQGNPDAGLKTTRTYRYVQAVPGEEIATVTALKFSSGDPAVLVSRVGRGQCILVTTSFETGWGTWVVWPSFPPLIHEIVTHAVSGRWSDRQLTVGQPLQRPVPVTAFDMPVTLLRPDGTQSPTRLVETGSFPSVTAEESFDIGIYELELGSPVSRKEWYAVNLDTAGSDLARTGERELGAGLFAGVDFKFRQRWQRSTVGSAGAGVQGGELARWLLAAVFALLLVETLMAWRFSYGFAALTLLVVSVFAGQAVTFGRTGAWIATGFATVAFGAWILHMRRRRDNSHRSPLSTR